MVQCSNVVMNNGLHRPKTKKSFKGALYQSLPESENDVERTNRTKQKRGKRSESSKVDNCRQTAQVHGFGQINGSPGEAQAVIGERTEMVEMGQLRSRVKQPDYRSTASDPGPSFIERDIRDGETLQSISLKYCCQVSEIKRINNLIQDQDFHALTKIKVPVKRFGLLPELIQKEKEAEASGTHTTNQNDHSVIDVIRGSSESEADTETDRLLIRTVSIRDAFSDSQSREAQEFLHKMDQDIHSIVASTRTRLDSLEEVTDSLTAKRIQPLRKSDLLTVGADCGMSRRSAVIVMVLVGLFIPLIVLLYYQFGQHPD